MSWSWLMEDPRWHQHKTTVLCQELVTLLTSCVLVLQLTLCRLPVSAQFSPCTLIGKWPLSGVMCLTWANTLASFHPSLSLYCHASLVSCQLILDEDCIYMLCLLCSELYALIFQSRWLITACYMLHSVAQVWEIASPASCTYSHVG